MLFLTFASSFKNIIYMQYKIVVWFFVILSFSACSNDFELTEKGKETPLIYGLLSPNDTAIYVRVEKTFVNEDVEPAILAQDPANLYYDNVEVVLRNLKNPSNEFILQKVDGTAEGYPRAEGFFVQAPNILYKLKKDNLPGGALGDNNRYEILVRETDGKVLASAQTEVLRELAEKDITSPSSSASLAFDYNRDFNVSFRSDPYAFIHDIYLTVYFSEEKDGVLTEKSLRWPIVRNLNANQPNNLNIQYGIKGRSFYEFLKSNLEEDPRITRFLKFATIEVASGGFELREYINIVQANLGITSSGEIPSYTNVNNGIGLFSSRTSVKRENVSFAIMTRDSISNGIITKNLNFR